MTTCVPTKMEEIVGTANHDGFYEDMDEDGNEPKATTSSEDSFDDEPTTSNNHDNTVVDDPASLLPPVTATQVDDEASMDIAFISMQQLLNDPAASSTTTHGNGCTSAGLEPSIVSGTTDLFEGDLCDDELPSILMSNGGDNQYENLQLNPVELVEEVQEEVQQEAAADPDAPATLAAAVVDAAALPSPASLLPRATTTKPLQTLPLPESQHPRRPVVPFVKVRKLSDAEACTKKRPAVAAVDATLAKKARTAPAAAEEPRATPRMTRSRIKKAGPAALSNGLSAKTRIKKDKPVKAGGAESALPCTKKPTQPPKPTALVAKTDIANTKDGPRMAETTTKAESRATTPPVNATEAMISDAGSITGSVSSATDIIREATESAQASSGNAPIVTPVGSEDAANEKQLAMATKVESASLSLPNLQSSTDTVTTAAKLASTSAEQDGNAAALEAAVGAMKESHTKSSSETTKKSSSRRSSSKAKSASARNSKPASPPTVEIDTSTEHIQALTGENGASVCLSARNCTLFQTAEEEKALSPAAETNAAAGATKGGAPATSPLTEEERMQQSRDRNRKHARNTRLRKKAYVEELKQTLNELVAQRDRTTATQEQNRQRELEQREVRFRVMEEFLNLRGRNEPDSKRWSAILLPPFTMTMPQTSFQEMAGTSTGTQQELVGVEQAIQDSCHFAAFLQTLGKNASGDANVVSLVYQCDRKDFMMDGCKAALGWSATSVGAVDKGAIAELTFHGNLRAHFCPESNRLRSTHMLFDTGAIINQRESMQG